MYQGLRQSPLRLLVIEIGNMNDLLGLLNERFSDGRMRMPERADGDAAAQVEITPAIDVVEMTPRAVA